VIPPPQEVERAVAGFGGRRVVVLGDVMLDRFVWGDVDRISPEAPVPVVRVRKDTTRLGGAANVAANVVSLGGTASVHGVVGDDPAGAEIATGLARQDILARLISIPGRETTVKTRVLARAQQVVRVDRESDEPVSADVLERVRDGVLGSLAEADALVISDYAKGIVREEIVAPVLAEARLRGIPVVADPKRLPFDLYQPVTVLKPNQTEAGRATAMHVETDAEVVDAARRLLDRLDVEAVLISRGARGMLLARRDGGPRFIEAVAREVYDVTGAGDTVVAVLALALAAGHGVGRAAELANLAGGIVVGKIGTATVTVGEIVERAAAPWPQGPA